MYTAVDITIYNSANLFHVRTFIVCLCVILTMFKAAWSS